MRLTFDRKIVEQLADFAEKVKPIPKLYDMKQSERWLALVGDHGVYLMVFGKGGPKREGDKPLIAYANEINPETMEFEAWWDAKGDSFGGDDGCDAVPVKWVREWFKSFPWCETFELIVKAGTIGLPSVPAKTARARA